MSELTIEELQEEKKRGSYELVYSPKIEAQVFDSNYSAIDKLWKLYYLLSEGSSVETLTITKLFKLANYCRYIGKKPFKKIDIEIFFKKLTGNGRPMNFKCFCEMMTMMIDKMDEAALTLGEKCDKFFEGLNCKFPDN